MAKKHREISIPFGLTRFTNYSDEFALLSHVFNVAENCPIDMIQVNAGRISETGYRIQMTLFNRAEAIFRVEPIYGIRTDTVRIDEGVEMRFDGLGLGQQSVALTFILDTTADV